MTDESAALATTETDEQSTETEQTALQQAAIEKPVSVTADKIPEKFRTMKEDGSLDYELSAAKMAESYSYLEKKLGSGDAPPKSATEYQPVFSEESGITFEDVKDDPVMQEFTKGAHELGITNKQLSYILDQYMKVLPDDINAAIDLKTADTIANLKETTWKTDAELKAGLSDAHRAVSMVAGDDAQYLMDKYGNDPAFIRFAASFGEGMREDTAPAAMQMIPEADFADKTHGLRQQLIDMSATDPRRASVQKQLNDLYDKQVGTAPAHGLG